MMKKRVQIAILAFALFAAAQTAYRALIPDTVNDLAFPICGGAALLRGGDPYTACPLIYQGRVYPLNPLTTILVALPFSPFGLAGAILLWSTGAGLMVYALSDKPAHLLILFSAPFWDAARTLQWSPLLLAVGLLPALLPLTLVKPQGAIPLVLTRLTKKRALGCAAFLLLTFLIDPSWPLRWLPMTKTYDGFVPVLVFPPLILLLFRWRSPDACFILLSACMPQRGVYDALTLWLVAKRWGDILLLSLLSWCSFLPGGIVAWIYVPLCAYVTLQCRSVIATG